jgi:hypothetical protein
LTYLNNQDAQPSKTFTSWDRPQRLVLSGVWQLPFGRGRKIGSDIGRGLEMLVGGWEYNWIATFQSGNPIDLNGNVDIVRNAGLDNQNFDRWFNPCVLQLNGTSRQPNATRTAFDSCADPAWAVRGPNTLRTIPLRVDYLRVPWAKQYDMSLNKRFNFTERINAQFRAEAFNVFNTPIRRGPDMDPNGLNFGLVRPSQANLPRNIQLGFKLNF